MTPSCYDHYSEYSVSGAESCLNILRLLHFDNKRFITNFGSVQWSKKDAEHLIASIAGRTVVVSIGVRHQLNELIPTLNQQNTARHGLFQKVVERFSRSAGDDIESNPLFAYSPLHIKQAIELMLPWCKKQYMIHSFCSDIMLFINSTLTNEYTK